MGHIVFIFLHLIAIIFGFWLLIITIPTHLIYGIASSGKKELKEQVEVLKEQTKILKGETEEEEVEEKPKTIHKYEKHFRIAFFGTLTAMICYGVGMVIYTKYF